MIDWYNESGVDDATLFDLTLFQAITDAYTDETVELLFVDDTAIRELNREHRRIDKATDVLSFPLEDPSGMLLGSIVISAETAVRVANELGHTALQESTLLFIHGFLHLLGYDHETDQGEMRQLEAQIATAHHLPESLLVRSED